MQDFAQGASPVRVVVVGSVNMDLVAEVARLPRSGETVAAERLLRLGGGKGANQAVAAARLGATTALIGRVGDDPFGAELLAGLQREKIEVAGVSTAANCSSGVALIAVDVASGQNSIVVVGGANSRVTPADVERHQTLIAAADVILLQLEIPLESVQKAANLGRSLNKIVVLDPAPARDLPDDLHMVDLFSPNQTEAEYLTGIPVSTLNDAERAARRLKDRGCRHVVMKLGALGLLWLDEEGQTLHVPSPQVKVVDTTAAGDAFTAALAIRWAECRDPQPAGAFACAAGALACTRLGAQAAMPTRTEVEQVLSSA